MKGWILALIIALVTLPACGPQNPNVTPQASVAHYATDVLQGLTAYQALLVKATEGPNAPMTVEQAKPQMDKIREGLVQAQKLSGLLKSYDTLTTPTARQGVLPQIQAALTSLSTLGLDAAALPAQLLQEGVKLVNNVSSLVASAKAAIATGGM